MFLSFPLIPLLLFAICLFSLITFYLARRVRLPLYFGKVLRFTILYICLNSFYCFIKEVYFPDDSWKEKLAPFVLLYGPLLYFGVLSLKNSKLPIIVVCIHSIPFICFLIHFLLIHAGLSKPIAYQGNVNRDLSFVGSISFVAYTLSSFWTGRRVFIKQFRDKLLMFVFARIILLFLAVLFVLMGFSKTIETHPSGIGLLRMTIYCCLLIIMMMIFNFIINKLLNRFSKFSLNDVGRDNTENVYGQARYEKSTLTDDQLNLYQERLDSAMIDDQLFLDSSLSLSSLAAHLKIPNHHLTQVLSVKTEQTFYQFVNGYRIDYACNFLYAEKDTNIEELAEKSGFNSKVSFNRQFKNIKGCTPSEYRTKWHS
jgi:AraC-like DNA-binding protein